MFLFLTIFHNFIISTFSYIYKFFVYTDKTHKICNGCDANIERRFAYKIKNLFNRKHYIYFDILKNNHEF